MSESTLSNAGLSQADLRDELRTYFLSSCIVSLLVLTEYCLAIDLRPKDLVELKKTLSQKRKAWVAGTSSKKMGPWMLV